METKLGPLRTSFQNQERTFVLGPPARTVSQGLQERLQRMGAHLAFSFALPALPEALPPPLSLARLMVRGKGCGWAYVCLKGLEGGDEREWANNKKSCH